MKQLATNRHGLGAAQHFKAMTPISIYCRRRSPMNRHNRRMILSVAAVVLSGTLLEKGLVVAR